MNFVWPSSPQYSGGVVALYEFANALARRGHDVHFIHGPAFPDRIDRIDQLDWFTFEPSVRHHIVDRQDDPSVPDGDIIFSSFSPARLGLPVSFVQGHRMMSRRFERSAFEARCPKICVASWLVAVAIEEFGVPPEQLFHVPLGIDHGLFQCSAPFERRPVDVAVLYHSHPAKGWAVGAKALEMVRERRPDLRVDVFGVLEPDRPIPKWMRFHRHLARPELARSFNASSIFVQPSLYEGFGFTAVEAMASGAALVTTDNGGSQDYAHQDVTALVVPPGDSGALATAIETLLDDDDRRMALARAGERHVRKFDWDLSALRLEEIAVAYLADPPAFQAPSNPPTDPPEPRVIAPRELAPRLADPPSSTR